MSPLEVGESIRSVFSSVKRPANLSDVRRSLAGSDLEDLRTLETANWDAIEPSVFYSARGAYPFLNAAAIRAISPQLMLQALDHPDVINSGDLTAQFFADLSDRKIESRTLRQFTCFSEAEIIIIKKWLEVLLDIFQQKANTNATYTIREINRAIENIETLIQSQHLSR